MNMKSQYLVLLAYILLISLLDSCIDKSEKEFQSYMKENYPDDIKISDFHSLDSMEFESVNASKKYLNEHNESPGDYYIYLLTKKNDTIITINIEHISGYRFWYYWEKERKQMCPVIGNISGKGKTFTWDSKNKKIVSVGVVQ